MPECHREFALRSDQDPRFTYYCPACRELMKEVTPGTMWIDNGTAKDDDLEI